MTVRNIYMEVSQHEVWMCECTDGKFYLDALQNYKVVHWNYPEITPTQEQIEKAKVDLETDHHPFFGRGTRIYDVEAIEEQIRRQTKLDILLAKRQELETNLGLIDNYIKKATK